MCAPGWVISAITYAALLVFSFSAFSPAHAQCTAPDGVRGEQVYNVDHCVMQYCNGTVWMALGRPRADCPDGDACASAGPGDEGTVCADGSVYAGRIDGDGSGPGGDVDIFAAPYDLDNSPHTAPNVMSDGTTNRGAFVYKVSAGKSSVDECNPVNTAPACHDGQTLTDQLVNGTGPDGPNNPSGHHAAIACDNLSFGGSEDWYLPSVHELALIYNNMVVGGPDANTDGVTDDFGFDTNADYWSSSEHYSSNALFHRFDVGSEDSLTKFISLFVRCVRRQGT